MFRARVNGDLLTEMYDALVGLEVGQPVAQETYIHDYVNGEIPAWHVVAKRPGVPKQWFITVEDRTNVTKPDLFFPNGRAVRMTVIIQPNKILASPVYLPADPEQDDYGPCQLHDLVHNAKINRKELQNV